MNQNVVRFLIKEGIPKNRLIAIGLADSLPIRPTVDENGRTSNNQAANRRIVMFIHRDQI